MKLVIFGTLLLRRTTRSMCAAYPSYLSHTVVDAKVESQINQSPSMSWMCSASHAARRRTSLDTLRRSAASVT